MSKYLAFVQCTPGLEDILQRELVELGVRLGRAKTETGGLAVWVDREALWTIANQALVADAIRLRVGAPFYAPSFKQLLKGMAGIAPTLKAHVRNPSELRIVVRCKWSKLIHSDAVAERVAEALNAYDPKSSSRKEVLALEGTTLSVAEAGLRVAEARAKASARKEVLKAEGTTLSVRLLRDQVHAN
jgi:23S rRNA G2445 N2-methylase RlmL